MLILNFYKIDGEERDRERRGRGSAAAEKSFNIDSASKGEGS